LAFLAGFLAAILWFFCGDFTAIFGGDFCQSCQSFNQVNHGSDDLLAFFGYDFCQSRQSFNQVNHGSDKNPARKNPACSSKGKRKRIVFAVVDLYA